MQTDTPVAAELAERSLAQWRELGDPAGIASALMTVATVARDQGDFGWAVALLEEGLALWRGLGNKRGLASLHFELAFTVLQQGQTERAATLARCHGALMRELAAWPSAGASFLLGQVAWEQGDLGQAQPLLAQSLALSQALVDKRHRAVGLYILSLVVREQGDLARAAALGEESLALARELGGGGIIGWALQALGLAACEQGDFERAGAALAESLALFWARGMRWFLARSLAGLAILACAQRQAERAARFGAATEALCGRMAASLPRAERALLARTVAAARAALGDGPFNSAWAAGQALATGQIVAEALEDSAGI